MALIIGGHPRSGTTLLRTLCNRHPELAVTMEFGVFAFHGRTYVKHCLHILRRWAIVGNLWAYNNGGGPRGRSLLSNLGFTIRYLARLPMDLRGRITAGQIEATLRRVFPEAQVVGDKWPHYLLLMKDLSASPNMNCLAVYRDCRDVTASFLEMNRKNWKNEGWAQNLQQAGQIARNWVRGIEAMELAGDSIRSMRYEDLIDRPGPVIAELTGWLGVDPLGFPIDIISARSVGKYKKSLDRAELDQIMQHAGPTMKRLGYL